MEALEPLDQELAALEEDAASTSEELALAREQLAIAEATIDDEAAATRTYPGRSGAASRAGPRRVLRTAQVKARRRRRGTARGRRLRRLPPAAPGGGAGPTCDTRPRTRSSTATSAAGSSCREGRARRRSGIDAPPSPPRPERGQRRRASRRQDRLTFDRARPQASGRSRRGACCGGHDSVSVLVTSPLRRAVETAEEIASALTDPEETGRRSRSRRPLRRARLRRARRDGARRSCLPGLWDRWRSEPGWRPPGGETLEEVGARVAAACEELAGEASRGNVIVVSHVSPIKAAVSWALGGGPELRWRLSLGVASITRIATGGPRRPGARQLQRDGPPRRRFANARARQRAP